MLTTCRAQIKLTYSGPFRRGWGGEINSEGLAKERQKGVFSVIMVKTIATIYQELA